LDPVNSILRAVRVLDILEDERALSYMTILQRIDIPKSALFKILATLEAEDLVKRDPDTRKYRLGVK